MADITKVDVVQIDTSQSVRSVADLKKEIRSLKDQLIGLSEGTEEYSATLTKLGDDMHTLREINEQASMTNQDFGTNISNATRAMSGMAGAVGAVTSALSMMGIQAGDDAKLMKTLMQAMAISQGLSQIDAGVKSLRALATSLKAAKVAQEGFNISAAKNPYLIIGMLVIAAIVGIVGAIKKQEKEEKEQHEKRMQQLNDQIEKNRQLRQEIANQEAALAKYRVEASQMTQEQIDAEKERLALQEKGDRAAYESMKKRTDELRKADAEAQAWAAQAAKSNDAARINAEQIRKELNEAVKAQNDYARAINDSAAKQKILAETTAATAKNKKDEAKAQKEVYTAYQKELNAIKLLEAAGEDELTIAEMNLRVENEHLATLEKGTKEYDEQLIKVAGLNSRIANLKNQEKERTKELQQQNIEQEKQNKLNENNLKDIERQIDMVKTSMNMAEGDTNSYKGIEAQAEQEMAMNKLVYDNKVQTLTDAYNAEQDYYNNLLQLYDGDAAKQDEIRQQMKLSQAQYNLDMLNAEKDLADQETEVNKKKNEQKKALDQQYANFAIAMTSQLSGLISAFADAAEEGSQEQKNLQVASAIINTLAGAAGAFMQGVAAYPPPYGEILGAAGAATALATGFAQVSKMKATKVSKSSSANVSNVTVQSIATPTSNVRQLAPQFTDEGQVEEVVTTSSDQRVVLVYSDLEAADSQRVSVDSSNAM